MLLFTMNEREIVEEIKKDIFWVHMRCLGLDKKYGKLIGAARKSKRVIKLGITNYKTPRGNSASIFAWADAKGWYAIMAFRIIENHYTKLVVTDPDMRLVRIFTNHFIARYKERNGNENFLDSLMDYMITGHCWARQDDGTMVAVMEHGWCPVEMPREDIIIFKTFVANDMLGEEQKNVVGVIENALEEHNALLKEGIVTELQYLLPKTA